MKDLKKRLEDMQNSLGLNVADVQQRLRLLLLDDPAMAGLAEHVDALETLHSDVVDALHRHMLQFPETSAQLQQPGMLQRLKGQQQRYYQQLLHGPYDLQYARLRLLVGLSHEREQVEQKWYLGAYHFYLNHMQGAIRAHWAHDPELADRLFACLLKIVFFDLTLAVDTYSAANKLALEESRARYARAVEGAHDGIWEWNVVDDALEVSERWLRIVGLAGERAPSTLSEWAALMPDMHRTAFNVAVRAHLAGYKPYLNIECQMRDVDGQLVWVLIRGLVSEDNYGIRRLAGSLSDINLRKSAEQDLAHATFHDPLTGLPNRQRMNQLLLQALQRQAKPGARHASVLFIDLDRFKLINDSLGHQSGDKVLVESAKRIGRCLRPGDHLCRFGGDEFVVLLDDLAQDGDAEIVARRIMQELHVPMLIGEHRLVITASIGVAPLKGNGAEQDALREADLALYRAKAYGKSQLALYSETLQEEVNHRLTLENALSEALLRNQFELYYQPIVKVEGGTSRVIGVEALLRWWQDGTMISPDEFIPVLEESGQIVEVGEWVLREACRQVKSWHDNGLPGLRCSVNLSSRQLHEGGFAARVAAVLEETGFPASSLVLEITESLLMQDVPDTLATLRELESLGIRIALDDFGTGFSSLGYLHRYPLHIIKVDKSFITRAPDDERLGAISRAIIGLGRGLRMDVIAEGIETPEQMRFLRDEGCHYIQGYWFSRPLSADNIHPVLVSLSTLDESV
ncbi:diguanylate cyclase/phosphodiesterase [Halopseudomonas xinjiangensis]|uniref:Diguanylate cyclase DosC n=1 Tax=Halopseudomonas xinjiangensis TaxID=487184 RepID=A0A1H1V961_9GAMM|nr:EAL domain-containing protein [Halopseudomonas xinjiangensis]SDS81288.1 diguanylate cyclase/phosphodiesterase [Halopseudomonas xinjiangensis]